MKATKVNWAELLNRHEDRIKEAIEKAFALACDGPRGVEYAVEVSRDGEVSISEFIGSGSMSQDVWSGEALEVARKASFDPADGDSFDYFPADDSELSDEEKAAFEAWCRENDEEPTPAALEEWNPEVYQRWRAAYRDSYISAYEDEYAEEAFERAVQEQELLAGAE